MCWYFIIELHHARARQAVRGKDTAVWDLLLGNLCVILMAGGHPHVANQCIRYAWTNMVLPDEVREAVAAHECPSLTKDGVGNGGTFPVEKLNCQIQPVCKGLDHIEFLRDYAWSLNATAPQELLVKTLLGIPTKEHEYAK